MNIISIIQIIKEYWVIITFLCGVLAAMFTFGKSMIEATKCSLRNDILEIYDRCKEKKQITKYQLESIEYSYKQYKSLRGNSFVQNLVEKVETFEIID